MDRQNIQQFLDTIKYINGATQSLAVKYCKNTDFILTHSLIAGLKIIKENYNIIKTCQFTLKLTKTCDYFPCSFTAASLDKQSIFSSQEQIFIDFIEYVANAHIPHITKSIDHFTTSPSPDTNDYMIITKFESMKGNFSNFESKLEHWHTLFNKDSTHTIDSSILGMLIFRNLQRHTLYLPIVEENIKNIHIIANIFKHLVDKSVDIATINKMHDETEKLFVLISHYYLIMAIFFQREHIFLPSSNFFYSSPIIFYDNDTSEFGTEIECDDLEFNYYDNNEDKTSIIKMQFLTATEICQYLNSMKSIVAHDMEKIHELFT
jgi:hypothetical protein